MMKPPERAVFYLVGGFFEGTYSIPHQQSSTHPAIQKESSFLKGLTKTQYGRNRSFSLFGVAEYCVLHKICILVSYIMEFFNSAVGVLQTLVVALGAGLGIWGAINLLEGYGNDNRATRS